MYVEGLKAFQYSVKLKLKLKVSQQNLCLSINVDK